MFHVLLLTIACLATASSSSPPAFPELHDYNPVANAQAVVTVGNARFTLLTERVVRMEYSDTATFVDNATTAVLNRDLPVPKYTATTSNHVLTLATAHVTLTYAVGQPFTAKTLSATGPFGAWRYGQDNPGNLLGTIKSLDLLGPTSLNCTVNKNITVHDEDLHCAWGVISRDGWAVVDDSSTYVLDHDNWWTTMNPNQEDLYLFAHGLDFKGALFDFVQLSGKTAMPPRAAFGVWWTRWFNYNAVDLRDIVSEYRDHHLPLDVFVLDMDWHVKPAWGSYSWDRHLFSDPSDSVHGYLKGHESLVTLANIHDDNGVAANETQHAAMVRMMQLPNSTGDIPFAICSDQAYATALEDAVLWPVEKDGIDYWWIDWQQGGNHGGCNGLLQNPTLWTNKIRATDHLRRHQHGPQAHRSPTSPTSNTSHTSHTSGATKRGLVLARWGGLGSHRYQVGFSGDVQGVTWSSLAYQPYFSMTSTNVAYGFWSHDIVGPGSQDTDKLELYTRWLQWATYSGVFRSHDRGSSGGSCAGAFPPTVTSNQCTVVKPWNVPLHYFKANRAALQRRAALVPYTYTLARDAYDTGLGPLRPMYYEYPRLPNAYNADMTGKQGQYFYGNDMIVSPVTSPSAPNSSFLAQKTWWVPPGTWVEENSHQVYTGNADGTTMVDMLYALHETPVLVRAGAIITTLPSVLGDTIGVASRQYTSLIHTIYPGAKQGRSVVYEDDGRTTSYAAAPSTPSTTSATTTTTYTRDGDVMTVAISTVGTFPELPTHRASTFLHVVGGGPIKSVSLNGHDLGIAFTRYGIDSQSSTWTYCHRNIATVIHLPSSAISSTQTYTITFAAGSAGTNTDGVKGAVARARLAKDELDLVRTTPGAHQAGFGALDALALFGDDVARLAGSDVEQWKQTLNGFSAVRSAAVKEVNQMAHQTKNRHSYVMGLLKQN